MRRSEIAAAFALAAAACVVKLDHEFDGPPPGEPSAPPAAPGCVPIDRATGDLRSIALADGGSLWIADQASSDDGGLLLPAAFHVAAGAAADCSGFRADAPRAAIAPSPVRADGLIVALDLVDAPAGRALYFALFAPDASAPLGLSRLGFGVAQEDADAGAFVPSPSLAWTTDAPSFGTSALRDGDFVVAFGCKDAGSFASDCFLARASAARIADVAAYEYWTGAGWSSRVEDASPVVRGVSSSISVRRDPTGAPRFVMTYVPALGRTLEARSAPALQGPWSDAVALASCDLSGAGAEAFCAGGQQHPEVVAPASAPLVVSYDARTFASDAGAADAFRPRLVALPIPAALR